MAEGTLSPREMAQLKSKLAGEYAFVSGQLEDILARKPRVWNSLRADLKSDKATDREWEATEDGINETGLRLRLKAIEKMMSALNSMLQVAEGEARNNY